jgi:hypothetical protein
MLVYQRVLSIFYHHKKTAVFIVGIVFLNVASPSIPMLIHIDSTHYSNVIRYSHQPLIKVLLCSILSGFIHDHYLCCMKYKPHRTTIFFCLNQVNKYCPCQSGVLHPEPQSQIIHCALNCH